MDDHVRLAVELAAKVEAACADRETKTYGWATHEYLRNSFKAVFITADGAVVDTHKHYIEACGQTEHLWFIKGLENPKLFPLRAYAKGPKLPCL